MELSLTFRSALLIALALSSNSQTAAQSPFGGNAKAEKLTGGIQEERFILLQEVTYQNTPEDLANRCNGSSRWEKEKRRFGK